MDEENNDQTDKVVVSGNANSNKNEENEEPEENRNQKINGQKKNTAQAVAIPSVEKSPVTPSCGQVTDDANTNNELEKNESKNIEEHQEGRSEGAEKLDKIPERNSAVTPSLVRVADNEVKKNESKNNEEQEEEQSEGAEKLDKIPERNSTVTPSLVRVADNVNNNNEHENNDSKTNEEQEEGPAAKTPEEVGTTSVTPSCAPLLSDNASNNNEDKEEPAKEHSNEKQEGGATSLSKSNPVASSCAPLLSDNASNDNEDKEEPAKEHSNGKQEEGATSLSEVTPVALSCARVVPLSLFVEDKDNNTTTFSSSESDSSDNESTSIRAYTAAVAPITERRRKNILPAKPQESPQKNKRKCSQPTRTPSLASRRSRSTALTMAPPPPKTKAAPTTKNGRRRPPSQTNKRGRPTTAKVETNQKKRYKKDGKCKEDVVFPFESQKTKDLKLKVGDIVYAPFYQDDSHSSSFYWGRVKERYSIKSRKGSEKTLFDIRFLDGDESTGISSYDIYSWHEQLLVITDLYPDHIRSEEKDQFPIEYRDELLRITDNSPNMWRCADLKRQLKCSYKWSKTISLPIGDLEYSPQDDALMYDSDVTPQQANRNGDSYVDPKRMFFKEEVPLSTEREGPGRRSMVRDYPSRNQYDFDFTTDAPHQETLSVPQCSLVPGRRALDTRELYSRRCGACTACNAPDCGKCSTCKANASITRAFREVCWRNTCEKIPNSSKLQQMPGFPESWCFLFDRRLSPKKNIYPDVEGLIVFSPGGSCVSDLLSCTNVDKRRKSHFLLGCLGADMTAPLPKHPLLNKLYAQEWLDLHGRKQILYGRVSEVTCQWADKKLTFRIDILDACRRYNVNVHGISKLRLPDSLQMDENNAWGGCLFYLKKMGSSQDTVKRKAPQNVVPLLRLVPEMYSVQFRNGLPQARLLYSHYELVFTVRDSETRPSTKGVFLSCKRIHDDQSVARFLELPAGHLLDMGIYAPFSDEEIKSSFQFAMKNFVLGDTSEEHAFHVTESTEDRIFDIADDDGNRDLTEPASRQVAPYVAETFGTTAGADVVALQDPIGTLHYFLGESRKVNRGLRIKADGISREVCTQGSHRSTMTKDQAETYALSPSRDHWRLMRRVLCSSMSEIKESLESLAELVSPGKSCVLLVVERLVVVLILVIHRLHSIETEFESVDYSSSEDICTNGMMRADDTTNTLSEARSLFRIGLDLLDDEREFHARLKSNPLYMEICNVSFKQYSTDWSALSYVEFMILARQRL